jgi:LPXTG-motif cell wall-anchored protein
MSTGAIAGIVIGAILGLALIIGAAIWWLRRKQKKTREADEKRLKVDPVYNKPELDSTMVYPTELNDENEIKEMDAQRTALIELAHADPVELPVPAAELQVDRSLSTRR